MTTNEQPGGDLTVIPVPEQHAKEVLDYIASLSAPSEEVSGHMMLSGAIGGALSAKGGRLLTACWRTGAPSGPKTDWSCSDVSTL